MEEPNQSSGLTGDDAEILCPLCDYNLRGLIDQRCPECGFRFDLDELRDPARRRHSWLFEHHPEANVRSFIRTVIGGLRPRRFWTTLHPTQPSRPRRLTAYWLIGAALFVVLSFVGRIYALAASQQSYSLLFGRPRPTLGTLVISFLDYPVYLMYEFIRGSVAPLFYPWITLLTLLVFQTSIPRVRIRRHHLIRCVLYSCDPSFWLLFVVAETAAILGLTLAGAASFGVLDKLSTTFTCAVVVLTLHRVYVAIRYYLRLQRLLAVFVASQVIVALVVINAYVLDYIHWHW